MIYLKTSVGIELRGEDILIASLQSNFSGGAFTHFSRIAGYRSLKVEDLQREINQFFRSHGLSKDNIVLGIPRKEVVLRYLDLPPEVADNLKQVIQYQVQSFEPTEEDKFYHDYALLRGNGQTKRLTVLLAMVRKATLDEILQLLLPIGIRPIAVTGSSMGLANIFLQNRKNLQDKTFILGDLSTSSLEILALREGALVFSREVPKGEEISWRDVVLRETAEAISKMRLGPEGTVEKMALAGESSSAAFQEIKTEVPDCELIESSMGLEIPVENRHHIQEAASTLGLAYTGLNRHSPIKLNLLPAEKRIHQSRWAYLPAAALALIILGLLCALGFHRSVQNQKLALKLDQQLAALEAPVHRVQSYREQSEDLEKKTKSIEELLSKRDMNLEVLRELTTILPQDTYLTSYRYQDGTIQIIGMSPSASELVPKLNDSKLLKDVTVRGSIFKNTQINKEQFTFEMKLER